MCQRVAALGVGSVERFAAVFVEAHVGVDAGRHALHRSENLFRRRLLALQRPGHNALESHTALRKIFAQPARLLAAKIGEAVVVGTAE